jgi:hypothetical protein
MRPPTARFVPLESKNHLIVFHEPGVRALVRDCLKNIFGCRNVRRNVKSIRMLPARYNYATPLMRCLCPGPPRSTSGIGLAAPALVKGY